MSSDPRLALRRPREVGAVLRDALGWYVRRFGVFLAIGATVVVPVYLIVLGLGLEQLFSEYDVSPPVSHQIVEFATTYLITAPLVAAMTTYALLAGDRDELRGAGGPISAGLEAFTPVFLAVLLAAAGVVLGLFLLIIPGIYLLIRWYFVPQAVVVDKRSPAEALQRSGELVQGSWWRVLGTVLLAAIAALVPQVVLQLPFEAAASAADSEALSLAGRIIAGAVLAPYIAIVATLLYFDLRSRKEGVPPEAGWRQPAEDGSTPADLERPEAPLPPDRSG